MLGIFNEQKVWIQKSIGTKGTFQMGFMDITPATAPKWLTSETTFSNCLSIVVAYSKIPKLYGMERVSTEEVMYKLDIFQSIFGKID